MLWAALIHHLFFISASRCKCQGDFVPTFDGCVENAGFVIFALNGIFGHVYFGLRLVYLIARGRLGRRNINGKILGDILDYDELKSRKGKIKFWTSVAEPLYGYKQD